MTGGDKDKPNPVFRVYNSMTKDKEYFMPLVPGEVRMYVCGVTAYDLSHIGHARAAVNLDVLFRYLMHLGYEVTYVRNFTNVDGQHVLTELHSSPVLASCCAALLVAYKIEQKEARINAMWCSIL